MLPSLIVWIRIYVELIFTEISYQNTRGDIIPDSSPLNSYHPLNSPPPPTTSCIGWYRVYYRRQSVLAISCQYRLIFCEAMPTLQLLEMTARVTCAPCRRRRRSAASLVSKLLLSTLFEYELPDPVNEIAPIIIAQNHSWWWRLLMVKMLKKVQYAAERALWPWEVRGRG